MSSVIDEKRSWPHNNTKEHFVTERTQAGGFQHSVPPVLPLEKSWLRALERD